MDTLTMLVSRRTTPPAKMADRPLAPDTADSLLAAAIAAPDHGKLRPWRFVVIEGDAREHLGQEIARALKAEGAIESDAEEAKVRSMPMTAPLLIVVACAVQPDHPKIPAVEQLASTAAATQNILLAAHARGLAAKWATGKAAYSEGVRRILGLAPSDQVMAIVFVGEAASEQPVPERPDASSVTARWRPAP